jgi:NitT/TauT family transport system permease protein
MAQIYTGAASGRERTGFGPVDLVILLALVGLVYTLALIAARLTAPIATAVPIELSSAALPQYAGLSVARMAGAYVLSLAFSLADGRVAATHRGAERVMLPLLDVLQSIPILAFMPGVVLALVALFPSTNLGIELAAVVLIITSQAWNLAFGVYQSRITIPAEFGEVAALYRLNGWRRFTKLELPAAAISLVWNSMMSWAGGWFFLMAAEQFTLGDKDFRLPGLGSYLKTAADEGDIGALLLGLAALLMVILLLDQLVWRPLVAWAERFKLEQTESTAQSSSWVLTALRRSAMLATLHERVLPALGDAVDRVMARLASAPDPRPASGAQGRGLRRLLGLLALLALAGVVVWGSWSTVQLLRELTPGDWSDIPAAAGATGTGDAVGGRRRDQSVREQRQPDPGARPGGPGAARRRVRRAPGPLGVGQVDAAAYPRRAGRAFDGLGAHTG